MKIRTLAAAVLMTTLFAGPVMAQMAAPPPNGYGDYDEHHQWRDQNWWYEHHPDWVAQHHPDGAHNGDWDEHHHWHDRHWWVEHHPHWF